MEGVPCGICELGQFPDRAVVTYLTHPWQPHFPVIVTGQNLVPSDINVLIHDPVPFGNQTNQELFSSNGYNVNFRQSLTTKNGYQISNIQSATRFREISSASLNNVASAKYILKLF